MMLVGKRILLGISGGIAAYKCADLVRQLKKQGAEVRVAMTASATHFVSPLALQAVAGQAVSLELFDPSAELSMSHIELAKWADWVVIAPATANIIAKLAHGLADDLLSTLCLATPAPIAIAPAMNQQMYHAAVTQQNIAQLRARGVHIWGPAAGEQACGDVGLGRMLAPQQLVEQLEQVFCQSQALAGLNVVITAGPTQEALDPVRYITNHSSGKMGFALAQVAAERGAQVTLISGPVNLLTPTGVTRIDVKSALDMQAAVKQQSRHIDIFIACAAVADYRAAKIAKQKIKKQGEQISFELVKNPDIVAEVAQRKKDRPYVVGFAAETKDIEHYAQHKLKAKNLDLICANDVSSPSAGFNVDHNQLTLYWSTGKSQLPLLSKQQLARELLTEIMHHYEKKD